ncbi:hypothetical protein V5O48_003017 [Marasmius crinis-equi]|uniref:F-box domain-containing protein n=1 Tax=Marasmius crinis-equi TaxID=585013 RepID=A0ABR3FU43_9AGAR
MRTCRMLNGASTRPFLTEICWKNMTAFTSSATQIWDVPENYRLATVPQSVELGGRVLNMDNRIRWADVFPTIHTFSNLRSLIITNIEFPLHDLFVYLEQLPVLSLLSLVSIQRDGWTSSSRDPQLSSYSDSLRELIVQHMPMSEAPFLGDSGFMQITSLLSRPGLTKAELSMDTFVDVLNVFDETGLSFSESLVYLEVKAPTFQVLTDDEQFQEAWCTLIRDSLKRCAPVLQYLRLFTIAQPPEPPPPLHLPALIEYFGPHEMLGGLTFSSAITTIWVPSPIIPVASSSFKLATVLPFGYLQNTDLRFLSVLRWSASDTRVEDIFRFFPRLQELSLHPSFPVSKVSSLFVVFQYVYQLQARLIRLAEQLRSMRYLRGLSILNTSGKYRLTSDEKREILDTWRKSCKTLTYVRFDTRIKFVWELRGTWLQKEYVQGQIMLPLGKERRRYTQAFCNEFLF